MGPELARQADRVRRRARSRSRAARAVNRRIRSTRTFCTSPTRAARSRIPGRSRTQACTAGPWRPRTPDQPTYVELAFERGDAVAVDGEALSPAVLLARLNQLAGANGIGRVDLVENRFVGMKSRGVYETPGGTVLLAAHRAIEIDHARSRRGAPQGRAHAALRRADLQRLLVQPRARDAAGPDRPQPGTRDRAGAPQVVQGHRAGGRSPGAAQPVRQRSPPSRRTPCTTSATPRVSSS